MKGRALASRRSVLAGLAMTGCSRAQSQEAAVVVAYGTPTLRSIFARLRDLYGQGVSAGRVRFEGALNYDDLLRRNLLASYADRLPDVTYDALCYLPRYVEKGLAIPLSARIPLANLMTGEALAARIGEVDGRVFGAPFAVSSPVIYVNAALVERVRGDPDKLPASWEGVLELAARISRLGEPYHGVFYDYDQTMAYAWQALLFSRGGHLMEPRGDVAFDGEEGQWAMRILQACGKAGQQDLTSESAQMSFAAGLMGMYVNTSSILQRFQAQIGGRFPLSVQPFPIAAPNGHLPAAGNCAILLADERHRASARDWLDFSVGALAQNVVGQGSGYLSLNDEANARPDLLGGYYARRPLYRAPLSQKSLLTKWEVFPGPNGGRIATLLRDAMQSVIVGAAEPDKALSAAAHAARAYLRT